MTERAGAARLIKKVVIGYDLTALPPTLIRGLTLLRGKLARKRFRIEVILCPLTQLPPDTDVLFVPAGLLEAARQAAPAAVWVAALNAATTQQTVFDELIERLEAGQDLAALPVDESADASSPEGSVIVRYRGNERIG